MSQFASPEARRVEFRDPLIVLIQKEERTCKGCVWAIGRITLGDESLCAKDRLMRRRCTLYVDSNNYANEWRNRNAKAS